MSKIKVLAGLVPSETYLLGLQMVTFSLRLHVVFSLHMCTNGVSPCAQISSYKTSHIGLGPTLMASFQLIHLFTGPFSKYSHILRC